jgi:ribosomal protein L7/L12
MATSSNNTEMLKTALLNILLENLRRNDFVMARKALNMLEMSASFSGPTDLSTVEIDYIKAGRVINAIKEYRNRNGVGLKEAKDAIDAYRETHGIAFGSYTPGPSQS